MDKIMQVGPSHVNELQNQVDQIISEAMRGGASACEVVVDLDQGLSISVRNQDTETVEFNQDQGFGVTVYRGTRKGSASTSATGVQAVRDTVAAALAIAANASEDPCHGLASKDLMSKHLPDLDLYHPHDLDPTQVIELAKNCEAAALENPKIKQSSGSTFHGFSGCKVYGNSHGFMGHSLSTRYSLSCIMLAEADKKMQRDYDYDVARAFDDLKQPQVIGTQAATKTVSRLNAKSLPTGDYAVILAPEISVGFFNHFLAAISGGSLYRKASFLEGKLGKSLFPEWLNISEHPRKLQGYGSSAFDGDGLATYDKHFIGEGVLKSYILGTYSGRKLGLPSTANAGGIFNVRVGDSGQTQDALLKEVGKGLLVTELMGQGANLVTGDYSRGAAGFWVENGQIQYPVQGMTIAGHLGDMFLNVVAVANDFETRGNIQTGSVWLRNMKVSGT